MIFYGFLWSRGPVNAKTWKSVVIIDPKTKRCIILPLFGFDMHCERQLLYGGSKLLFPRFMIKIFFYSFPPAYALLTHFPRNYCYCSPTSIIKTVLESWQHTNAYTMVINDSVVFRMFLYMHFLRCYRLVNLLGPFRSPLPPVIV